MVDVIVPPSRGIASPSLGYVEWGPIMAGAVIASALSLVLLTAGASIGLSLISPYAAHSYGKLAGSLAAFWVLAVPIVSLLVGGYITGRMRTTVQGASADEVQFRDGIHGLLVWSVSVVLGGLLAFMTAASAAQLGAGVGRSVSADDTSIVASAVDTVLRPGNSSAAGDAAATPGSPAVTQALTLGPDASRKEIARVLSAAVVSGKLSAEDQRYLAEVASAQTGLSSVESEKRIDAAYAKALDDVEAARKAAVATGLATATALLLGLAAAWYAAQRGGDHRDQNIPAKFRLTGVRRNSSLP